MSIKLSDLVIMSDVDGTLVTREMELPQRNVEALQRFVAKGGRFGLATGRSRSFADKLLQQLPVNFPCVFSNGGVICDTRTGEILYDEYLPERATEFARIVSKRFPGSRVVVQAHDSYYNVSDERDGSRMDNYQNDTMETATLDSLPGPWHKTLFIIREEEREEFFQFVREQSFTGVRFVSTNEIMHEMLPENCSKGNALRRLMELEGLAAQNLVCIGDFYNDREMIELAGIGATLRTSPDDLQQLAQLVVGEVAGGALADLVEALEARFES